MYIISKDQQRSPLHNPFERTFLFTVCRLLQLGLVLLFYYLISVYTITTMISQTGKKQILLDVRSSIDQQSRILENLPTVFYEDPTLLTCSSPSQHTTAFSRAPSSCSDCKIQVNANRNINLKALLKKSRLLSTETSVFSIL